MSGVLIHSGGKAAVSPAHLAGMHRLRYRVFKERLNWDIPCHDGMDRDRYDALDPIYALGVGEDGDIEGCWRLLPTTGPYMLRDLFPQLFHGAAAPDDPTVWEISRFAVLPGETGSRSLAGVHAITRKLLVTLLETCERAGIRRVVAASDVRFERILRRSGLDVTRFGPVTYIGQTPSVGGWIDIERQDLARIEGPLVPRRGAGDAVPRGYPDPVTAGA